MAGYSQDLRERVVKAHVEEGQNKSLVARRFGVSRWTVDRYVKRAEAGSLAATPHPGPKPWLDGAQSEVLTRQVDKYLRKLGITRKKRASMRSSETSKQEKLGASK